MKWSSCVVDTFSPALPDKFLTCVRRLRIIGIVLLIFNTLNNLYGGNFFAVKFALKIVTWQLFQVSENTVELIDAIIFENQLTFTLCTVLNLHRRANFFRYLIF